MRREWVPVFASICNARRMRRLPDNSCRLLYLLVLAQCDSWGRVGDDPESLWAECWATFGASCSLAETQRGLAELVRVELLEQHAANGLTWFQVPDWESKAGTLGKEKKRGARQFPDPTPESRVRSDPVQPKSGVSPESVRNKDAPEEKRVDVDVEGEQNRAHPPPAAGAARAKPKVKPTGPQAECIQHWEAEWARTRQGTTFTLARADAVAVADMLKQADPPEVKRRMTAILEDTDPWTAKKATPRVLLSQWNSYALAGSAETPIEAMIRKYPRIT